MRPDDAALLVNSRGIFASSMSSMLRASSASPWLSVLGLELLVDPGCLTSGESPPGDPTVSGFVALKWFDPPRWPV